MSKKKNNFLVKVLAIILTVLMITSMAFYTIYMIVESFKPDEEENKTETTQTVVVSELY